MQRPRSQPARWPPIGPTLASQYAVSRNLVRETVSRLRSGGLLVARPGSGVFVAAPDAARSLDFDAGVLANLDAVLEVVEMRRTLEAGVAARAATGATAAQRAAIRQALQQVDASVASGSAAVEEDLAFHRAVADAAGNPQFPRLLRHMAQYLRAVVTVTRLNASLSADHRTAVRQVHQAIVDALLAQDADAPIRQPIKGSTA